MVYKRVQIRLSSVTINFRKNNEQTMKQDSKRKIMNPDSKNTQRFFNYITCWAFQLWVHGKHEAFCFLVWQRQTMKYFLYFSDSDKGSLIPIINGTGKREDRKLIFCELWISLWAELWYSNLETRSLTVTVGLQKGSN